LLITVDNIFGSRIGIKHLQEIPTGSMNTGGV